MTTSRLPHLAHPEYRPDIDGLRALAILPVVAFHAAPGLVPGGFIGVDIFFVISGYLISSIIFSSLEKERFSFVEFYIRRIRRIFPSLLVVLLAAFLLGWLVLLPDEYASLGKHAVGGAAFVSNFVLWNESGYFDSAAETKPLLHLWSLAIEEQFYIFWPLLLAFVWKRHWSFLLLTGLIAAISFATNIYLVRVDQVADFYSPLSRFWELMIGGILAYITLHRPRMNSQFKTGQSALGFILLAASLALLDKERNFPGWWATLPTFGAFLMISAGPDNWLNRHILSNRVLVWFGLISYPLYLWHWLLLSFAQIVESGNPLPIIRVAAVGLSVLLAWMTYRFIELPLRFGGNKRLFALLLSGCMVAVAVGGYLINSHHGLPSRSNLQGSVQVSEGKPSKLKLETCDQYHLHDKGHWGLHCRVVPAGSEQTVAIFGDSHAAAAFTGIAEKLHAHSINALLLASWGCPQFTGAQVGKTDRRKEQCSDNTNTAVRTLLGDSHIKKVFIIARGPMYFSGKSAEMSIGDYFAHLQETIDQLHAAGKKVYCVSENPDLDFYARACSPRPFRIVQPACELKKDEVLKDQARYLAGLRQLKNVKVINSLERFCPDQECRLFSDGEVLYKDSDHLSPAGSRFQADFLSKYMFE